MVSWAVARSSTGGGRADPWALSRAAQPEGRARPCRRYAERPQAGRLLAVADHQSGHLGPPLRGDRLSMTGAHEHPTVVSLTPLPLEADSRTFRIARSLADLGLRSVVIEGRPSKSRFWGPEIEVRSPGSPTESRGVSPR